MKTVSKSNLKTHMFSIFRELEKNGGELIVTDNQWPVLKVTPIHSQKTVSDVFADLRNKTVIYRQDVWKPDACVWGTRRHP